MSELVALCFDTNASPSIRIAEPSTVVPAPTNGESAAVYGWGVGWYPSSERGASVVKDPTTSSDSRVNDALRDWDRFRSTVFLCHLRGHRRPRKQEDAQPFVRSYGGRQWIFAHDGDLAADWPERFPRLDDPAFEALGQTDSEHAFCLLLSRLHAKRLRTLGEVDPPALHEWFSQLNQGGKLNAMMTDGDHIAIYRDMTDADPIYWTRRTPPHVNTDFGSSSVTISLDDPEDPHRTGLIFSSVPLDDTPWQALPPGALVIARRGAIIWSSAVLESGDLNAPPVADVAAQDANLEQPIIQGDASALRLTTTSGTSASSRTLQITHETLYQYETLVERSSHRLLLRPVDDPYQRLVNQSLTIEPAVSTYTFDDVFGNCAINLDIHTPYSSFQVASQATVELRPILPLEQRVARRRFDIPLHWMPWQQQMLSAYLLPPELPETQLQELSEFAMSFVARNDSDLVGTLLDLNDTIYRDFQYMSGSTTNETTPFEVYDHRRGVCQDFANLMICVARLLQIPARYRMGYIFTGADYENKIQSEASHAWVELYLPKVGWHGLDPTNGIQVDTNHVRVACGRNYRDATPTSGTIFRGGGTETLTTSVRVEEVYQGGHSQ